MTSFSRIVSRGVAAFSCAALLLSSVGGCASGNFASELSSKPQPRTLTATDTFELHLPAQEKFSIARPQANEDAGLYGKADANADARPDGTAIVQASASDGGKASAQFQLGHAFQNNTDRQLALDITVRFKYESESAEEPADGRPDAAVGLKLYARDSRNRIIRNYTLMRHTTEEGPATSQDQRRYAFPVTLAPGEAVSVYLGGEATATVRDGYKAQSRLALTELEMDVVSHAAPAIESAPQ